MGQKQKKIRQNANVTRQKNKRGDTEKKWDQTDSPEIPDRGETSEIPQPPFGDSHRKKTQLYIYIIYVYSLCAQNVCNNHANKHKPVMHRS